MARRQARLRALKRLTNRINGVLYNREYIEKILQIRSNLRIDITKLTEVSHSLLAEREIQYGKKPYLETLEHAHTRIETLTQCLLDRHLIGKRSAKALSVFRCWPDSSRFWQMVFEADEIDWPDEYYYVPRHYIVGGLCFKVSEYINKYQKTQFDDVTIGLMERTKGGWDIGKSILSGIPIELEEYLYFHAYVRYALRQANLLYYDWDLSFEGGRPLTFDSWKNSLMQFMQPGVYLNVTELYLDDFELLETDIEIAREQIGAYERLPIGRKKGIQQSRKSGLDDLTWKDLRKQIRENPKDLNKLWNEYVSKFGRQSPLMRRRARDNFYKQIIVHRDMLDLKLQIRKRGRPRKSTTE